jgi:hypothetical protein
MRSASEVGHEGQLVMTTRSGLYGPKPVLRSPRPVAISLRSLKLIRTFGDCGLQLGQLPFCLRLDDAGLRSGCTCLSTTAVSARTECRGYPARVPLRSGLPLLVLPSVSNYQRAPSATGGIDGSQTHRWRKAASNRWSHFKLSAIAAPARCPRPPASELHE